MKLSKVLLAAIVVYLTGCASKGQKRERIQIDNPDCYVMEDLTIECPDPFADNVGFGTGTKTVFPKNPIINNRRRPQE